MPPVTLSLRPRPGGSRAATAGTRSSCPTWTGSTATRRVPDRLAADDGRPVYWVETSRTEDGPGGLITGISVLEPGTVGSEYAMTRGHLHAVADRSELYVGLSGHGVMILDTLDGQTEVVEVTPGKAVYVPGHWVHRSVNVGTSGSPPCSATPPTPARTTRSSSGPAG